MGLPFNAAARRVGDKMKIKVIVRTNRVGSTVEKVIEVDDEASDMEISEEAHDVAIDSGMVEIDWARI